MAGKINEEKQEKSHAPIIGILCVDIAHKLRERYGDRYTSYLAASYVKFIEGGGGRVVPLWIGKSKEYYENMLCLVNGIVLPGGAVYFNEENGFADAGKYIYNFAVEMNKKGVYLPIFGICLGYELLLYASAGNELRQDCDSVGVCYPLDFRECAKYSKLYGMAGEELMKIFSTENVTFNYHKYCITEEDLKDYKIDCEWRILSTNCDAKVSNYISSIEHAKYPFYGVQFHPERNIYEHKSKSINHSENAIKCSNYLAQFFVNEARKNENRFQEDDERKYLIYNYAPTYTYHKDIAWEQCYLFEGNVDYVQN